MGMISSFQSWARGGVSRLPAQSVPSVAVGIGKPSADFTSSTDNKGQRLAWARYQTPWAISSPYIATIGSYTNRERSLAATVATDLSTSNPTLSTILLNLTTHNVGNGLSLSSKIDADAIGVTPAEARALSSKIEKAWRAWAGSALEADLSGRHDLHGLATAAVESYFRTGELVAVVEWKAVKGSRTRTKLQLLDSRQLDQTKTLTGENGTSTINGVTFDKDGRVIGYYLIPITLGKITTTNSSTPVPAYTTWGRQRVIHLFELRAAGQVRGLSPLVSALTPAQEKATLGEFTLAGALVQTQYALTIESDLPPSAAMNGLKVGDDGMFDGAPTSGFNPVAARMEYYDGAKINAEPGVVNHLSPGDKLKINRSETPNATFEPFDNSLSRAAAKAAGSSYEDISGDYSKTSFSASRLALETPHRINLKRRAQITEKFYAAAFRAWLEEAIETGIIGLPKSALPFYMATDAYCNAKWLGSGRITPDPFKAAQATVLEIESGLTTLTDALAERGLDFEEVVATRKAEMQMLKDAGLPMPSSAKPQPDQPNDGNDPEDLPVSKRKAA
ncbi:lambda family phage portal protein [Nitrobacteraceae bacterium AZCC 2161]